MVGPGVGQPCLTPGDGGLATLLALCPADSSRDFKNYVRRCHEASPSDALADLEKFLVKRIAEATRQGEFRNRHWDWEPLSHWYNKVISSSTFIRHLLFSWNAFLGSFIVSKSPTSSLVSSNDSSTCVLSFPRPLMTWSPTFSKAKSFSMDHPSLPQEWFPASDMAGIDVQDLVHFF